MLEQSVTHTREEEDESEKERENMRNSVYWIEWIIGLNDYKLQDYVHYYIDPPN
jgi:hypothetical protein